MNPLPDRARKQASRSTDRASVSTQVNNKVPMPLMRWAHKIRRYLDISAMIVIFRATPIEFKVARVQQLNICRFIQFDLDEIIGSGIKLIMEVIHSSISHRTDCIILPHATTPGKLNADRPPQCPWRCGKRPRESASVRQRVWVGIRGRIWCGRRSRRLLLSFRSRRPWCRRCRGRGRSGWTRRVWPGRCGICLRRRASCR